DLVSTLLGQSPHWPAAVVSDAQFALRRGRGPEPPAAPAVTHVPVRARTQVVTAVCQAAGSGDVFLGFASGEVACFRASSGELLMLCDQQAAVLSLAVNQSGSAMIALHGRTDSTVILRCLGVGRGRIDRYRENALPADPNAAWLCPEMADTDQHCVVGV